MNKEARADDRNKEDISFYLQLFNSVLQAGVIEEDFVRVFRMGRRGEDGEVRPLMVQLASHSVARQCVHCGKGHAASQWEMAILGCQNSVTPEPID